MEVLELVWAILEVGCVIPLWIVVVAKPFYTVFELSPKDTGLQNFLNLIFVVFFPLDGKSWGRHCRPLSWFLVTTTNFLNESSLFEEAIKFFSFLFSALISMLKSVITLVNFEGSRSPSRS